MPGLFDLPATQDVPDPGASSNPYLLALGQFLGGIGRTAYNAAKLPGDVYQGNVQVGTPQYNQRAFDLASMMVGTPGGSGGLGSGIRAYHGSPYDFDRFDMSKIGTGEGAQVYGHGLYFAENPATAEEYKKAVYRKTPITQDEAQRFAATKTPISQGRMYDVNINADPEHFLDWDKPLGHQSDAVYDALWNHNLANEPELASERLTGADWYNKAKFSQAWRGGNESEHLSAALRDSGIPGIKYLDQGSRGAGEGTRNYVVFDDNLISILRKYGLVPGAAIPPTIGGMMGLQGQPQGQ